MKIDEDIDQNRPEFWPHVQRDYDIGVEGETPSGSHSRAVVIGRIVTIAIADSMSDALGTHVSEESKNSALRSKSGKRQWRRSSRSL